MDAPFNAQGDEISDYGSDFTPDEEGILNELLLKIPNPHNAAPTLVIENLDCYGRPQGFRTPRMHGREKPKRTDSPPPSTPKSVQIWTPAEVDGDEVLEATGGQWCTQFPRAG